MYAEKTPQEIGAECFAEDLATLGMTPRELGASVDERLADWGHFAGLRGTIVGAMEFRLRWTSGYQAAAAFAAHEDARRVILLSLGCAALGGTHDPASDTVRVDLHPGPTWMASADSVVALGQAFLGLSADEECEHGAHYLKEWIAAYAPTAAIPPPTDEHNTVLDDEEQRHER